MIGNAVPVNLSKILARQISIDMVDYLGGDDKNTFEDLDTPKQITLFFTA